MGLDWANVSWQEAGWSIPAALALLVTLALVSWAWQSFAAIRSGVKRYPAAYRRWGPRWNFSLLLIGAMIFFALGWLGYLVIGAVAMATPPPIMEQNREAAYWFGWVLIGMEGCHALAQALLWGALRALSGEPIIPRLAPFTYWPLTYFRKESSS